MPDTMTIKMRAGQYLFPVQLWSERGNIFFQFGFNKVLQAEIKRMAGSRWHGYDEVNPRKNWSVTDNRRNRFQIEYLRGTNPYAQYETPLETSVFPTERYNHSKKLMIPILKHQPFMAAHMLQRRNCIVAGEMGTSKTLAAIMAMEFVVQRFRIEHGRDPEIYYVAPRSALRAVEREFIIWGAAFKPEFMTYEAMTKKMKNWPQDKKAPFGVWFDESSKLKTFTTQRSQAAYQLAEGIRNDWDMNGYVVLMSGSPAPKSPLDWWSQAEIACPGFLVEGDIYKFKDRLAIIVQKQAIESGGVYPELVCWRDDEKRCQHCGEYADAAVHKSAADLVDTGNFKAHEFQPSINEVAHLYKRLAGLVIVYFKKDCLDLPEKVYRIIECKPSPQVLRAARLITKSAKTTIQGLTLLRELSDGFQYTEEPDGDQECPACNGLGTVLEYEQTEGAEAPSSKITCPTCKGKKTVPKFKRGLISASSPKDDALKDLLDEYEDVGRVVVYAGFTGSIDRIVQLCLKENWAVIRVDQGRDIIYDEKGRVLETKDYLSVFQDERVKYPRVAFVAHPGSAGMGLTLTASPIIIYYSNDFNGESRIQSEDRIHRPSMDVNRGATICDLIHLPSDLKVLENLKAKRELQSLTLGDFVPQGESIHADDTR